MAFSNVLTCFADQPTPAKAWLVAAEFFTGMDKAKTPTKDSDVGAEYDAPPTVLEFPFNPSSLGIQHDPDWSTSSYDSVYWRSVEYKGTNPDKLDFEILVDESVDRDASWKSDLLALFNPLYVVADALGLMAGNTNRVSAFVHALHALARPIVPPDTDGEAEPRPPLLIFVWGELRFYGFLNRLDTDYVLFDLDGNPRRATIKLAMTGRYLRETDGTKTPISEFTFASVKDSKGKDALDRLSSRSSTATGDVTSVTQSDGLF